MDHSPSGAGIAPLESACLQLHHAFGCELLSLRRPCAGLQRGSAAYRPDVQHGPDSHDIFRMHVLSLERPEQLPHRAKSGSHQSARLRQRRAARHAGASVPSPVDSIDSGGLDGIRCLAPDRRPSPISEESSQLDHFTNATAEASVSRSSFVCISCDRVRASARAFPSATCLRVINLERLCSLSTARWSPPTAPRVYHI